MSTIPWKHPPARAPRGSGPDARWYGRRVRALITGISGFVGRHLADELTRSGYEVHGADIAEPVVPIPSTGVVHGVDILDADAVAGLVAGMHPDVIVHLAGAASVGRSFAEPRATWDLNVGGTLSVLEAVRLTRPTARTLVVTSSEVYGLVDPADLPCTEGTPLHPHSPYGASKAAVDLMVEQYRRGYALDVLRVRPFNHLGPGQDARFLVPSVARQVAAGERGGLPDVEVRVGNTATRRDFLDVRDVARAYRLILQAGDPSVPYVVASGRSVAVQEILDLVAGMSSARVRFVTEESRRREGEQADLYGSSERLTADTGWAPEHRLADTVRDTLDYWRARVVEEE